MRTKFEMIPIDDDDLTGCIDKQIEFVELELDDSGDYVRIDFKYDDPKKPICAANITKNEAIMMAKQILLHYNATNGWV